MVQIWFQDNCPECRSSNWINDGDPSDLTAMDVGGIKCWKCGHCWKLDEFSEASDEDDFEDGRNFIEVKS